MTRTINTFQFPMISSCTPYNQSDFSPEVHQLCQDEAELLADAPGSPTGRTPNTNPFSLATSASAVKTRLRVAKCIVVGDISVGKTTLINRFVNDIYSDNYKATIGVDFEVQKFDILGRPFTLQIWDTAGQSRFRDITRIYYKGAHAVIICFDLSNFQSFINVKFWLNEVLEGSASNSPTGAVPTVDSSNTDRPYIFLVGTKKDLISSRDVEERMRKEATELAEQIQAEFWLVSSADGENVGEIFTRVACLTFNRYMANIAELARQELENAQSQSVFYTNGAVKLPEKGQKKDKSKKRLLEENDATDPNRSSSAKSATSHRSRSSRKALVRFFHVPQEIIVKFLANTSEQMQSLLKLRKRKRGRSNKVGELATANDGTATPDSGIADGDSTGKITKPKRKTFSCFGYRCTFSVEQ